MVFLVKSNPSKIFSVIIPVHNSSKFIGTNIFSLVCIDFPSDKFEVIFVDDASSDDSCNVISEALDSYNAKFDYRILRHENSAGPGIARNTGLSIANGEWILFLDSDDQFLPHALSELADYIYSRSTEEDLDLVFFDGLKSGLSFPKPEIICKHACLSENLSAKTHVEEIKSVLRLEFDEHVIFCAFSRHFVNRSGLKFESGIYEDVLFISQALILSRNKTHLNLPLYVKVSRDNQITGSFSLRHAESYLRSRNRIWEWLKVQRNLSLHELISDYHFGVRGAMGILYRRSSTEISSNLRIDFDVELTMIAVQLFDGFEKIVTRPPITELDLVCFSRYRQLAALGVI